jgi:hypothetical protein
VSDDGRDVRGVGPDGLSADAALVRLAESIIAAERARGIHGSRTQALFGGQPLGDEDRLERALLRERMGRHVALRLARQRPGIRVRVGRRGAAAIVLGIVLLPFAFLVALALQQGWAGVAIALAWLGLLALAPRE